MSVACIISFAISLGAIWVSVETHEEIAGVLSASIAGVSLIVTLVLASWQVQLLIVLILLVLSKGYIPDDSH